MVGGTGDQNLIKWHKQEQPIIPHPPDHMKLTGFRDPYIIQQGGPSQKWKMLLGSGIEGQGGTLLLYEATDLTSGPHHIMDTTCFLHFVMLHCKHTAGCYDQSIAAYGCRPYRTFSLITVCLQLTCSSHCCVRHSLAQHISIELEQ